MTVLAALDAHARARPRALALDELSYEQLRLASLRVAARLRERGIGPNDRVAIFSENRQGFVFALLGLWRVGATAVPVNVLYRASDLEHVLNDAEVRAVCVSESRDRKSVV